MKSIVFIFSSLMIGICLYSQDTSALKLGLVKTFPMRDADVYKFDQFVSVEFESPGITIISKVDSCFSFCDVKIDSVINLGQGYIVRMISEKKMLFCFLSFTKVFVQKNDQIKKGELIGLVAKDDNKFKVIITGSTKRNKRLNEDQIWQLIKDE